MVEAASPPLASLDEAEERRVGTGKLSHHRSFRWLCVLAAAAGNFPQACLAQPELPGWAFPGPGPTEIHRDLNAMLSVPDSAGRFTRAQTIDPFAPPDWHPGDHPPMPPIVAHGRRPAVMACGYCHLPGGTGRPENASLAGLPAAYIAQQLGAFADGTRRSALPFAPAGAMAGIAGAATPGEVAEAARYFSALPLRPAGLHRELALVPRVRFAHYLAVPDEPGVSEPIAGRLLTSALDLERHERRDSAAGYVTYVPVGAWERGRALAGEGPEGAATKCVVCHGPLLQGSSVGPPLQGQFPAYLLRQLLAFHSGSRHGALSALMRPVVARLSVDEMVALATYVSSP